MGANIIVQRGAQIGTSDAGLLSETVKEVFRSPSIAQPLLISYTLSCQQNHRMIHVSAGIGNLGFSPESWLDKENFRLKLVHEDDLAHVNRALQHSCRTGDEFNCLYRLYDRSGQVNWFHDMACATFDDNGKPIFLKGIMLDITDKKGMESELNEHRYFIERKVEQRTKQLKKRMALLEACNAALCKKLEATKAVHESFSQQTTTALPEQFALALLTIDCDVPSDGVSDLVRTVFEGRVAAAGEIA